MSFTAPPFSTHHILFLNLEYSSAISVSLFLFPYPPIRCLLRSFFCSISLQFQSASIIPASPFTPSPSPPPLLSFLLTPSLLPSQGIINSSLELVKFRRFWRHRPSLQEDCQAPSHFLLLSYPFQSAQRVVSCITLVHYWRVMHLFVSTPLSVSLLLFCSLPPKQGLYLHFIISLFSWVPNLT